jgi:predicted dehydrogenase
MTKTLKMNVGIIGCGEISRFYIDSCKKFNNLNIFACADIIEEKAEAISKEFCLKAYSINHLLGDPQIDVILNLTVPQAHAKVGLAALEAGKHLYNEKPLAFKCDDAKKMLNIAEKKRLLIGCAPDTFLGGGLQTCRKIIDDGLIGELVGCTCFMMQHGTENWHPNPEFHYKQGSGPMFEMGPYYLTALISLMGPIHQVTGSGRITFPERIITSEPKRGQKIKVEVLTYLAGLMNFKNGAIGTIVTSFDVWATKLPSIEIYGTEGTLSVPDPNTFGGPVQICHANSDNWQNVPLTYGYTEQSRGIGLADMAYAIRYGRPHRASGRMAYHVLEIMSAINQACNEKRSINIISTCERSEPLPIGLKDGLLDL